MAQKPVIALSVAAGIAGVAVLLHIAITIGGLGLSPRALGDIVMYGENGGTENDQLSPVHSPQLLVDGNNNSSNFNRQY